MYDTIHRKVPQYLSDLFPLSCESNPYKSGLRENTLKIQMTHIPRTESFKGSFSYRGAKLHPRRPRAASRDDGNFMGESLQQERESPWALTLTDPVPEAFEFSPSDWPEKYFSGQSAKRNSRATLMSSYTRLFSSSTAVVAWPVQREHF